MEKKFRVGAEASMCWGEIPVAAAASKPLVSSRRSDEKNYKKGAPCKNIL